MRTLFDATTIKGKGFKNRLFRSATWERLADGQGRVTPRLEAVYQTLARGGVGAIITSATAPSARALIYPGLLGLYDATSLDGHRRLVAAAHAADARILVQFSFAGQDGKLWRIEDADTEAVRSLPGLFARGAALAREAGYDGAQIHAAHGYFCSQFLNPATNHRQDEYGGDIEGRCRLLLEIHAAMRRAVGEDFLLGVKLDCRDMDGSPDVFETCRHAATALDAAGIDLVEISGLGGHRGITDGPDQAESVFREEAAAVAATITAPVALVGANRSPDTLEGILNATDIAYFSLARPLLREPDLPARWQAGDREPSQCLSCGNCYGDDGNFCIFTRD